MKTSHIMIALKSCPQVADDDIEAGLGSNGGAASVDDAETQNPAINTSTAKDRLTNKLARRADADPLNRARSMPALLEDDDTSHHNSVISNDRARRVVDNSLTPLVNLTDATADLDSPADPDPTPTVPRPAGSTIALSQPCPAASSPSALLGSVPTSTRPSLTSGCQYVELKESESRATSIATPPPIVTDDAVGPTTVPTTTITATIDGCLPPGTATSGQSPSPLSSPLGAGLGSAADSTPTQERIRPPAPLPAWVLAAQAEAESVKSRLQPLAQLSATPSIASITVEPVESQGILSSPVKDKVFNQAAPMSKSNNTSTNPSLVSKHSATSIEPAAKLPPPLIAEVMSRGPFRATSCPSYDLGVCDMPMYIPQQEVITQSTKHEYARVLDSPISPLVAPVPETKPVKPDPGTMPLYEVPVRAVQASEGVYERPVPSPAHVVRLCSGIIFNIPL